MAVFVYTALKPDGSIATGEINAPDKGDAFRRLERSKMQPVSLRPKAEGAPPAAVKDAKDAKPANKKSTEKTPPEPPPAVGKGAAKSAAATAKENVPTGPVKLNRSQIILFTEELSDLLSAGLQLEPALRIMESRDELSALKDVTVLLRQKIRDGSSFSAALKESSKSFSELYCNMAAAGEISGALPKILRRQAEYMTTIAQLQSKVTTAMIYPAFLFVAGTVVAFLFVSYLIPQLTNLLKSMNRPMPLPAVIITRVTDFVQTWWWLMGLVLVFGIWGFQYLTNLPQYKEAWHRQKLNLPLFGNLLRSRFYVQILETLSNLVGNGLPLLRALELTRDAVTNLHCRRMLTQVVGMVGEGASLSRSMKKLDFFPPLLTDMVAVGEQTGDIEHALARTAMRYDKELQKVIDRISALIQPAIILIMALIIGSMAYMMISVIMDSVGNFKR